MTSIAIINRASPYASQAGQESLDLVLAAASFGQEVNLFFMDDGVFQLIDKQNPNTIKRKHFSKSFAALAFYDVDNIFICEDSLVQRGLNEQTLNVAGEILTKTELGLKLKSIQHILTLS